MQAETLKLAVSAPTMQAILAAIAAGTQSLPSETASADQSIQAIVAAIVAGNRIVTIKQAARLRPAWTEAALRDQRFKAFDRKNSRGEVINGNGSGEAGVWLEVGGKVLIDLDAHDRWVQSHKVAATK